LTGAAASWIGTISPVIKRDYSKVKRRPLRRITPERLDRLTRAFVRALWPESWPLIHSTRKKDRPAG
jgi:hypothetical protein